MNAAIVIMLDEQMLVGKRWEALEKILTKERVQDFIDSNWPPALDPPPVVEDVTTDVVLDMNDALARLARRKAELKLKLKAQGLNADALLDMGCVDAPTPNA